MDRIDCLGSEGRKARVCPFMRAFGLGVARPSRRAGGLCHILVWRGGAP